MSKASQSMLASQPASGIGAGYLANDNSPWMPKPVQVTTPFVSEVVDVQAITGSNAIQPNATVTYEIPWEGDVLKSLGFTFRCDSLIATGGTHIAYVDLLALSCWRQITIKYGTNTLQTITPEQVFCKVMTNYNDEQKAQLLEMMGSGTPAERRLRAANDAQQYFHLPLMTCLGNHLHSDSGQSLYVRGLGERIRITIELLPATQWIESDCTSYATGNTGVSGATDLLQLGAALVRSSSLQCEFFHIFDKERAQLTALAKGERRILIQDYQQAGSGTNIVLGTTGISTPGASASFRINEFTFPTQTIYILPRWSADLNRRIRGAGGTNGCNLWNVGGWYNPGGGANALPIIDTIEIRVGSNNYVQRATQISDLVKWDHANKYPGTSLKGLLKVTLEHVPTAENSVTGFLDFEASDTPVFVAAWRAVAAFADINAAATADIGENSALDFTFVAKVVNVIRADGMQLRKPFS